MGTSKHNGGKEQELEIPAVGCYCQSSEDVRRQGLAQPTRLHHVENHDCAMGKSFLAVLI